MSQPIMAGNWMGDLYAKYPAFRKIHINRLLIPGSHDSGTFSMSKAAKTQSFTIKEQLENGMRYLDLRPKVHQSTYYVQHGQTGPDGSADLGHYSATLNPDDTANDKYLFKHIRDFLKLHPHEIVILKFQNYTDFGKQDYYNFIALIRSYFTFDTPASKCQPARFDEGNGEHIARQTVESLLASNKRVFVIWAIKDVPAYPDAGNIWDYAFQFVPSLTQNVPYCLWDPYWHDDSDSLADDSNAAQLNRWWNWHKKNLDTWVANPGAGFFGLQSQMQQLPIGDADASAQRNNRRNIDHYIAWAKAGTPMNIMTFDFVNYGDLCSRIATCYVDLFEQKSSSAGAWANAATALSPARTRFPASPRPRIPGIPGARKKTRQRASI